MMRSTTYKLLCLTSFNVSIAGSLRDMKMAQSENGTVEENQEKMTCALHHFPLFVIVSGVVILIFACSKSCSKSDLDENYSRARSCRVSRSETYSRSISRSISRSAIGLCI